MSYFVEFCQKVFLDKLCKKMYYFYVKKIISKEVFNDFKINNIYTNFYYYKKDNYKNIFNKIKKRNSKIKFLIL